mmetsp:Transcript_23518/g.58390  ORF Transcript_23518/g.58390 Transcript_23518/m.58390 type:complete len:109 (+) Transcript_23518:295-621(+)
MPVLMKAYEELQGTSGVQEQARRHTRVAYDVRTVRTAEARPSAPPHTIEMSAQVDQTCELVSQSQRNPSTYSPGGSRGTRTRSTIAAFLPIRSLPKGLGKSAWVLPPG